jgi:hypothetical protein
MLVSGNFRACQRDAQRQTEFVFMNTTFDGKNRPESRLLFPDWPVKLQADSSLTPGLRESYSASETTNEQVCG